MENSRLRVHLDFGAGKAPMLLGECLWYAGKRVAAFEWSSQALESGMRIASLTMPMRKGIHLAPPAPFNGLHAMLSDSLPDGFGLRLMDKSLVGAGHQLSDINPVHRLAWVGKRGLGALTYEPVLMADEPRALMDIAELGEHAAKADALDFADIPAAAIKAGGSAHGARPKFWAAVHRDGHKILLSDALDIPDGFSSCLVKFAPARGDRNEPFYEAACLALAKKIGVRAANGRLLTHPNGAALAVERFDRAQGGRRALVQSLAALLNVDFRTPQLDYLDLFKVSKSLTSNPEAEGIYRQACFNVALSMRDDHAKNFAFCMDERGQWSLSPAFDLCPSEGPGGWHTMTVSGAGARVQRRDLLTLAESMYLSPAIANDGIEKALAAATEFEALAISLGSQKTGARGWAKRFKEIGADLAKTMVAVGAPVGPSKTAEEKSKGRTR